MNRNTSEIGTDVVDIHAVTQGTLILSDLVCYPLSYDPNVYVKNTWIVDGRVLIVYVFLYKY